MLSCTGSDLSAGTARCRTSADAQTQYQHHQAVPLMRPPANLPGQIRDVNVRLTGKHIGSEAEQAECRNRPQ